MWLQVVPKTTIKNKMKVFRCLSQIALTFSLLLTSLAAFSQTAVTSQTAAPNNVQGMPAIPYPSSTYGSDEQRKLIERGEYLAKAGDCIACHTDTDHNGVPFTGGLGIKTPFGTLYSPNITPDKETGIGNWSDEDFIRAMQKGIAPNGSHYFPAFPFTSFTRVNKDDLLAIKAYLMSIPPVHKEKRENDMPWPFSWRFLQLGWKILFFYPHDGEYKNDPQQTPEWNRGAYLVQGLGHCGECHTPRNMLGGMKYRYYLTGAFVDNFYAPDITSHGLKDANYDDILNVFLKDQMLQGAGRVQGPMEEVNHDSLRYMTPEDLKAMAVYLKTVKSKLPPVKSSGAVTADTGKKIYDSYCATCHANGGAGAPITGDQAAWAARINQGMDVINQHAIVGFNSMPPKGTCVSCSDEEIKAAVTYMIDLSKPGAAAPAEYAKPKAASAPVKLSLAQGKQIYEANCAVCHAQGQLGAPKLGDRTVWSTILNQPFDVVIAHTINGYNRMPVKGDCIACSDAELIAAVKYMVSQSSDKDYSLW